MNYSKMNEMRDDNLEHEYRICQKNVSGIESEVQITVSGAKAAADCL